MAEKWDLCNLLLCQDRNMIQIIITTFFGLRSDECQGYLLAIITKGCSVMTTKEKSSDRYARIRDELQAEAGKLRAQARELRLRADDIDRRADELLRKADEMGARADTTSTALADAVNYISNTLNVRFCAVPTGIGEKLMSIKTMDPVFPLFNIVDKVASLEEFERVLDKAMLMNQHKSTAL